MRDAKTNQEVAKEFARMRARDIEQVERLSPAPPGQWYCKRRGMRGEDEWRLEPALDPWIKPLIGCPLYTEA